MPKVITCEICGHPAYEHGADGCYHVEYVKKKGEEILQPCECNLNNRAVYNQKGNQDDR
jgi:hypothetical protein